MKLAYDHGGEGEWLLVLLHGLGATRQCGSRCWRRGRAGPDAGSHPTCAATAPRRMRERLQPVRHTPATSVNSSTHTRPQARSSFSVTPWVVLSRWNWRPARTASRLSKYSASASRSPGTTTNSPACVMASMAVRFFPTKEEAVVRYLKVSGSRLVAPESEDAGAGVAQTAEGWRLAYDPATASVGAPPMEALLARRACRSIWHAVRRIRWSRVSSLRFTTQNARDLPGGHNVMVENPGAVWDWIDETLK